MKTNINICILTEDETQRKQVNFCKLTQQWLRFLLHQLNRESSSSSSSSSSSALAATTTAAASTTGAQSSSASSKSSHQPGSSSTAMPSSKLSAGADSATEGTGAAAKNSFVADIFAVFLTRRFKCSKCRSIWQQPHVSFPVTLNYPFSHSLSNSPSNGEMASNSSNAETTSSAAGGGSNGGGGGGNGDSSYVSFVDLLTNSILTEQSVQGLCQNCGKFHHSITEKRFVSTLPNIFAINTGLDNEMVNVKVCCALVC